MIELNAETDYYVLLVTDRVVRLTVNLRLEECWIVTLSNTQDVPVRLARRAVIGAVLATPKLTLDAAQKAFGLVPTTLDSPSTAPGSSSTIPAVPAVPGIPTKTKSRPPK